MTALLSMYLSLGLSSYLAYRLALGPTDPIIWGLLVFNLGMFFANLGLVLVKEITHDS